MASDSAFIFHMCIPCGKNFSSEPSSRSSFKVKMKYQAQIFKKNSCYMDIHVSKSHLVKCESTKCNTTSE